MIARVGRASTRLPARQAPSQKFHRLRRHKKPCVMPASRWRNQPAVPQPCALRPTRHRKISVRMADRCRVKNSRVKPDVENSNGQSRLKRLWVRQPSAPKRAGAALTENLMMGILIKPTSVTIAAARAPRVASSSARVSAMIPRYIRSRMKKGGGQPRVPYPPCAPHRIAPDRAGGERKRREHGRRWGPPQGDIGDRMVPDQRTQSRQRHKRVSHHCQPGEGHVNIHDPDGDALLVVLRRAEAQEKAHRDNRDAARAIRLRAGARGSRS